MHGAGRVGAGERNGRGDRARPERRAVLVTGGAGYIGSHAVRALRRAGYPVTVLDDLSSGRREAVPGDVALVRADIGDGRAVRAALAAHRIGAVMHLAALVGVAESVAAPEACDRINRAATAALVRAALEGGVRRLVFASSAAVYGVPLAVPVGEDAPLAPISPYGASKAAAERVLRAAARGRDFRYVALRLFNVAGAGPGTVAAGRGSPRLVDAACEAAVGLRDAVAVLGADLATADGTCVRDYVHVSDVAEALVAGLRSLEAGGPSRVVNCAGGRGVSVREVLAAVAARAGTALAVREAPPRPGDPPALVAQTGQIRAALGWSPRHGGIEAIVATTLARLEPRAVRRAAVGGSG